MSIDVKGKRLFVSALGNDTLEVIDLQNNRVLHTLRGLARPQGVLFVPAINKIFVANLGDGTVRLFDGSSFAPLKTISYGSDADNVRYDAVTGDVYVGYGDGALGEIDADGNRVRDIKLGAHPESFQLEKNGSRIFVNLPDSRKLLVVDRKRGEITSEFHTGGPQANFPMALDESAHRLYVVCREPARFIAFNTETGDRIASLPAIGDSDDVFVDRERNRIYAIGGEGAISIFQRERTSDYSELYRLPTRPGARTGFFSPDLDRLYVAARQQGQHQAELLVYAPRP